MSDGTSEQSMLPGVELAGGVYAAPGTLRVQFSRGGGPGGQNVNKVNTKAEIWVDLAGLVGLREAARARLAELAKSYLTDAGEIHISSTVHRTQERNREEVFDKVRELIVRALVEPKRRRKTRPSKASKRRRLEAKRRRGEIKAARGSPGSGGE
jgi:ribosome-associated protein